MNEFFRGIDSVALTGRAMFKKDPMPDYQQYSRQSRRLTGYDYRRSGAYFITICIKDRLPFFGTITKGQIQLSPLGIIVQTEWKKSEEIRSEVFLDEYVIMPDHFHAILFIEKEGKAVDLASSRRLVDPKYKSRFEAIPKSLGIMLNQFKGSVKRRANKLGLTEFEWQKNYYDRIIRDERELGQVRDYILSNPARWKEG